ncbi:GTP cyclohydrolase-2 [Taphrina deformans PYCC 5710]|uniref:GTP cyclohydrolase II n=1 Tax=Taphrina deformans (strain PYCC 5710 / ATCC 11124 / CBS 356.35 / IMI 108563 / JCM 9778 / NBRC 8474) TaxID=1097556 RepID=R4XAV6_TAPDE|nr:GTP cyclohydrolase-2 [Taphrina deformans PYCC 5710]|eukprot:CCG82953.1 GTP cyclohydrolase-2 [Taphrina deformans PYCC 5710]
MNIHLPKHERVHKGYTFPDLVTPSRSPNRSPASDSFEHNGYPIEEHHIIRDPAIPAEPKLQTSLETNSEHDNLRRNLKPLPQVTCNVRARIPTTAGYELFLHGYSNSEDTKEHLAIVIGNKINSKSLFEPRPGETEMDRMTRGAYSGRLVPGRKSSKLSSSITAEDLENGKFVNENSTSSTHRLENVTVPSNTDKIDLVRIHSECYTGETIGSSRCDCGDQLNDAGAEIAKSGSGVIVYLRQEGRGIGLFEKMKAYNLQDLGNDTLEANLLLHHPADARDYGIATSILLDLGCSEIDLLTNNPLKITAVEGPNREIKVRKRVEMQPRSWTGKKGVQGQEFDAYLATKITRMGHMLG